VFADRIKQIRSDFRRGLYDVTAHATEELAEDGFDLDDLECAVVHGTVHRVEKDDPRGTKYVVRGPATFGGSQVGIVTRFTTADRWLVIAAYRVAET